VKRTSAIVSNLNDWSSLLGTIPGVELQVEVIVVDEFGSAD
jgi:hypothetical protein